MLKSLLLLQMQFTARILLPTLAASFYFSFYSFYSIYLYFNGYFFFFFQQTPVFWEEEEVSDHLFSPHTVFTVCVIKAIRIAVVTDHILAHLYSSVAFLLFMVEFSVYFAPSICVECA